MCIVDWLGFMGHFDAIAIAKGLCHYGQKVTPDIYLCKFSVAVEEEPKCYEGYIPSRCVDGEAAACQ